MKIRHTMGGFALGLGVAVAAGAAFTGTTQPPGMDEEAMAMVQALKTAHDNPTMPSEFHSKLDHFIGDWDVTVKIWAMGAEAPPIESQGTSKVEWMLDGRFQMETLNAELDMGGMKMPLDSISMTGYDNYTNQYVGSMFSGMSTEIINFQGGVSPDGSLFNFYGTMHEPMLNVTGRLVRFTTTIIDEDHHTTQVIDLHAGEDYRVLEFDYKRK